MRIIRSFLLLGTLLALHASVATAAAPENLRNKSFTVSWTEVHNQSRDGGEFRDVSIPYQWTFYVSSAGRGFHRIHIGSGRGGATDEGVGKRGSSFGGGEHGVNWNGSG